MYAHILENYNIEYATNTQEKFWYNLDFFLRFILYWKIILQHSFFKIYTLSWLHVNNNFAPTLGGNAFTNRELPRIYKKLFGATFWKAKMECAKQIWWCRVKENVIYLWWSLFFEKIKINNASAFMQKCWKKNQARCKHLHSSEEKFSRETFVSNTL